MFCSLVSFLPVYWGISCTWTYIPCGLWCLAPFAEYNDFEVHLGYDTYQYLVSFYCPIVSHGRPQGYCGFSSRPLQQSKYHNKASHMIFWIHSAYKSLCCSVMCNSIMSKKSTYFN